MSSKALACLRICAWSKVKFALIAGLPSKPQEFQPRGGDVKLFAVVRVLTTLSGVDCRDSGGTIVEKHMVKANEI